MDHPLSVFSHVLTETVTKEPDPDIGAISITDLFAERFRSSRARIPSDFFCRSDQDRNFVFLCYKGDDLLQWIPKTVTDLFPDRFRSSRARIPPGFFCRSDNDQNFVFFATMVIGICYNGSKIKYFVKQSVLCDTPPRSHGFLTVFLYWSKL